MEAPVTQIAAVILAGGRGERLGGAIKANLAIGGLRLLDRVQAHLDGCRPIFLAHGPHDPALFAPFGGMIPVADAEGTHAGPLAGLAAAVAALDGAADLLVTAAVDTPFLPPDYLARLAGSLGAAPGAVASYAGQPYPTNAIWRLDHLRDLPTRVVAGTVPRSLKALAATLGAVTVDWPSQPAGDPFANVNTPAELAALEARAAASVTGF
jgi:molybdenum cofactor guanylyltransferase